MNYRLAATAALVTAALVLTGCAASGPARDGPPLEFRDAPTAPAAELVLPDHPVATATGLPVTPAPRTADPAPVPVDPTALTAPSEEPPVTEPTEPPRLPPREFTDQPADPGAPNPPLTLDPNPDLDPDLDPATGS